MSRCRNVLTTVRQSLGRSDSASDPDILETANEVFTGVGSVLASFDTNDILSTTTADDQERVKALQTAYTRVREECKETEKCLDGKSVRFSFSICSQQRSSPKRSRIC
jgi:hypothetical protein